MLLVLSTYIMRCCFGIKQHLSSPSVLSLLLDHCMLQLSHDDSTFSLPSRLQLPLWRWRGWGTKIEAAQVHLVDL